MLRLSRNNLIKIDTDGHKLEVLAGGWQAALSRFNPCAHIEFKEMNLFSQVFPRDFRRCYLVTRLTVSIATFHQLCRLLGTTSKIKPFQ